MLGPPARDIHPCLLHAAVKSLGGTGEKEVFVVTEGSAPSMQSLQQVIAFI